MRPGRTLRGAAAAGLLGLSLAVPPPAGAWFALTPGPPPSVLEPPVPDSVSGGYPFPPSVRSGDAAGSPAPPPNPPIRGPFRPGLIQTGAAFPTLGGDYTRPVRGFGHKEPVRDVLAQLLGAGWTDLYCGVAPGTRIDWSGGRTLPRTLDRIARTYGLRIRVDWTARTILLSRPGVPGPPLRDKRRDK